MKLDLREVQEALVSLSATIILYSVALILISIFFKAYLVLEPWERDYIVFVSVVNIPFCCYYLIEGLFISGIVDLHEKYASQLIKRLSVSILCYIPHTFFVVAVVFMDINLIEIVMMIVLLLLEILLIGCVGRLIIWNLKNK